MRLLILCALLPTCLLVGGCRSSEADRSDPAAAKAASAKAEQAKTAQEQAANSQPTNPETMRSDAGQTDPAHRSSARDEEEEANRAPPDHYDPGDAALYSAPVHRGGVSKEKVVEGAPSTPSPTPHTPIYRPLDAAGQPVDPKN